MRSVTLKSQHKPPPEEENYTFTVYLIDSQIQINIHQSLLVKDLHIKVQKKAQKQKSKDCYNLTLLGSQDGNILVDSWLQIQNNKLDRLDSKLPLKAYYSQDIPDYLNVQLCHFNFISCIGSGSSSKVYLVRHKQSCNIFALKMIEKNHITEFKKLEHVLREKNILMSCKQNPFVVKFYACFESHSDLNFLLEFCPGGEMFYHLQNRKFEEKEAKFYFSQVLCCFENLHSQKIIYRDLKPENIVIDMHGNIVLTDFGLAKIFSENDELNYSFCGSPQYMAPEIILQEGYNCSADFYSLGALLHELVTGLPPFYDEIQKNIFRKVVSCQLELSNNLSPDLKKLLFGLLDKNPVQRFTDFEQIKSSQWLREVNWKKALERKTITPIKINLYQKPPFFIESDLPNELQLQKNKENLFGFFNNVVDKNLLIQKNFLIIQQKNKQVSIQNSPKNQQIQQRNLSSKKNEEKNEKQISMTERMYEMLNQQLNKPNQNSKVKTVYADKQIQVKQKTTSYQLVVTHKNNSLYSNENIKSNMHKFFGKI